MTQEEKAKAYDEALGQAKRELKTCGSLGCEAARQIFRFFPELRESEDERIRKYLIEELKAAKSVGELKFTIPQPTREECIAYLEKQKEQKLVPKFKVGDTLKKKGKEYTFTVDKIQGEFYRTAGGSLFPIEQQDKWELVEQKPAEWSEEDKAFLKVAIAICNRYSHKDIADWLKSLPERFNLQPKVEWSDEDEEMRNLIIAIFEVNHPDDFFKANELGTTDMRGVHTEEIIAWLKSLRPTWKPSDEQITALWSLKDVKIIKESGWYKPLVSLYEQLKKL